MSIIRKIKNNRFIRGLYFLYNDYIGNLKHSRFGYIGENVTLTPPLRIANPKNVYLYGDNGLGNANIMTVNAKFIMKPHSGAAEGLRVTTGNHAMILGRFYRSITEADKPKGMDKDVIVESDVWIGRNVTILAGVTIGRGCTIGACSLVNKDTPPYTIVVGVPAKPIKFKWTIDEIIKHEEKLYPENQRLSRDFLEQIYQSLKK